MTYDATVEFKFDATYTPTYGGGFGSTVINDDFIPEEHYLITAPASDLNAKQYFKLFEKFMLCVGMDPKSIRSGAMSLVFNEWTNEEEQRKVCKEYELTMDEDLEKKYQEWKERDAQWAKMNAHYEKNFGSEPKIKGNHSDVAAAKNDWEQMTDEEREHQWERSYWQLYRRFQRFTKYTDEQLNAMIDAYDRLEIDSANGVA